MLTKEQFIDNLKKHAQLVKKHQKNTWTKYLKDLKVTQNMKCIMTFIMLKISV